MSFFPSLENVFYHPSSATDETFDKPYIHPHVKALRISVGKLEGLVMPGRFSHLRWLELRYDTSIPLSLLLEALQFLPKLQVLTLHPLNWIDIALVSPTELAGPIVTLHELKVLITRRSIPFFINAPKLVHLQVDKYPGRYDDNLCGFDFSEIFEIIFFIVPPSRTRGKESETSFSLRRDGVQSIFNPSHASYPNSFQLSSEDFTLIEDDEDDEDDDDNEDLMDGAQTFFPCFTACLKKTTNLGSIVLGSPSLDCPRLSLNNNDIDSFFTSLKGPTTVYHLLVFWRFSFAKLCDFLSDSTLFPCLRTIIFCNDNEKSQKLSDIDPLRKMMEGRFGNGPRQILRIGLVNFPVVQPGLLQQIEDLGIQLLQFGRDEITYEG
ncbi:hypothetical protein Clacol_000103 [Clathrus columnatus]|uniref:Uncharacterized protein n=1 Tax=Clathrus columnatus TaxID=1419009 RepID=A0AAV5A023_9AGAM|nr:hypothetical protein Clacol_000103 [Clathrus columnatus]